MEKVAHRISLEPSKNGRIKPVQSSTFVPSSGRGKFKVQSYWIILFGILLLAGFLRLYRIQDYMTFLGDEGRDVLVVYNILHGKLTLLGPTASVGGFFLGPVYYYFMAPFLWLFNNNPVGPAVMVALFGVATVFLIYKVGSDFFGAKVGLAAAILYSISPLVIAYSRSSWNPNLMPFFSLLTLYVLYKAVSGNKTRLFVLCGVLLGIAMQLHYLAVFLGVIVGAYVLLSSCHAELVSASQSLKNKILKQVQDDTKNYLYIFLGFIIGWLPFLLFEIRHGFPNLQSIINFIFQSEDTGIGNRFLETIYNVFFRLFARLVTNFPPPEQVALGAHPNMTLWYYATLILGIASVLILIVHLIKSVSLRHPELDSGSPDVQKQMLKQVQHDKEKFAKISILVLWLVFGVGLFGFYNKPIYDYYFGFMFPLPFMLVGLTIERFWASPSTMGLGSNGQNDGKWGLVGKVLAVGIFVVLVWINIQGVPFRFPPNRQLAQVEEISRFVIEKTDGKPFNFALITGGNSDHAYRYFFTIWNKEPVIIENPQKDPGRKTVTDQLLVVCEASPCGVLGHSLWEIAGFGRAEIVSEWNISVVKVYKLRHYR